jgi:hypothetical protein
MALGVSGLQFCKEALKKHREGGDCMRVVISGGHDRMVCQYKDICREHGCTAKVYTKHCGDLAGQIGQPDLLILFTNPVSHNMVKIAKQQAARCKIALVQSHSGSGNTLKNILEKSLKELA